MLRILALGFAACLLLVPSKASACIDPHVYFDYGSTQLSSVDRTQIAGILRDARSIPGSRVKLRVGTNGSKQDLKMARRRVVVVQTALARGGIHGNRVDVILDRSSQPRIIWLDVTKGASCG